MTDLDPRELRTAFGTFMTGVTVVTTRQADGAPRGFTANSFTSVSLDPPLLLVCVAKSASSLDAFQFADGFAVNVLAETQKDVANLFASKTADRFATVAWRDGPGGRPILDGGAAWFDCATHQRIDAGDHVILMGRVVGFDYSDLNGLGYARGGYFSLGLEHSALTAAARGGPMVVGAIVERDGAVLTLPDPTTGGLQLPSCGGGADGRPGSIAQLTRTLRGLALDAVLGPLYAVLDLPGGGRALYYRATGGGGEPAEGRYTQLDADSLAALPEGPIRAMLLRYVEEHASHRFTAQTD